MTRAFDGQVAMITGASRGLGRALALAFAREGASLAICARDREAVERVATEARGLGAAALAVACDVGVARDVERFAGLALDRFGGVDILVNNASTLGPAPLPWLADVPPGELAAAFDVNVVGPLRLSQAVLASMLLRGHGLIVNVSSDAAVTGYPGWGVYSATKAALDALTRSWAAELEGGGVRLLSVDPGDMDTEMHRAADPDVDPAQLRRPDDVALEFLRIAAGAGGAAVRVEAAALS